MSDYRTPDGYWSEAPSVNGPYHDHFYAQAGAPDGIYPYPFMPPPGSPPPVKKAVAVRHHGNALFLLLISGVFGGHWIYLRQWKMALTYTGITLAIPLVLWLASLMPDFLGRALITMSVVAALWLGFRVVSDFIFIREITHASNLSIDKDYLVNSARTRG